MRKRIIRGPIVEITKTKCGIGIGVSNEGDPSGWISYCYPEGAGFDTYELGQIVEFEHGEDDYANEFDDEPTVELETPIELEPCQDASLSTEDLQRVDVLWADNES